MFQFLPAFLLTTIPLRKGGKQLLVFDGGNAWPVEFDDNHTPRNRWRAGPVDHVNSCMFSYGCILQPLPNSTFCSFHHRVMGYFRRCFPVTWRYTKRQEVETGFNADVAFIRPDDMGIVSYIHRLNAKFKQWTTDCEFGIVKGAHAIVYTLTIWDAHTGETVISG